MGDEELPIKLAQKTQENVHPMYTGSGKQLMSLLRLDKPLRDKMSILKVVEPDGFVCEWVRGDNPPEKGQKELRMDLTKPYVLYTKQGWESMACVKLRSQFDRECKEW